MAETLITWYLKASKSGINTCNNYGTYTAYDDEYLISSSIIESAIELLSAHGYDILTYEFINHHEHCAKWSIMFSIGNEDYNDFTKNLKDIINFRHGLYSTSSIYVKHILDSDSSEDDNANYNQDYDKWKKIYKNKKI